MPWIPYPDSDDLISDWLQSLYGPHRLALVDPSVLPAPEQIDWDFYWAGTHATSFIVVEDNTTHINRGLGVQTIDFNSDLIVHVAHRYIKKGKPPILKQFREFLTKTLHENISPLPQVLRDGGINYMVPVSSRLYPETEQAQEDFWVLEIRLQVRQANTLV
jgi:hypothetical protein